MPEFVVKGPWQGTASFRSVKESVVPNFAAKRVGNQGMDSILKLSFTSGACSKVWLNEHQRQVFRAPSVVQEPKVSWRSDKIQQYCQDCRCVAGGSFAADRH